MKIETHKRPYILTFRATSTSYPLTSVEAARLIDEYPIVRATRNRVELRADDGHITTITAATRGGGDPFTVSA